jgi:hypothetical protein
VTGKEVETVATLLKRVRERADDAQEHRHYEDGSSLSIDSLAEGLKSLAAAVEMVAIEQADLHQRTMMALRALGTLVRGKRDR